MDDKIRELIDTIIDGNPVDSEAVFNDLMVTRVADRIDTYRQDVANTYFNPVAQAESEEEELATEEQVDETE
jgi:Ran GTPase-activating protein (RanGAP) involved in mRNA processing and transport